MIAAIEDVAINSGIFSEDGIKKNEGSLPTDSKANSVSGDL